MIDICPGCDKEKELEAETGMCESCSANQSGEDATDATGDEMDATGDM